MDFPQDCKTDLERAEYAQGIVEELNLEHQNRAAEVQAGTLTTAEFKLWEKGNKQNPESVKNSWLNRWKHASHVASLYMEGAGLKGKKDLDLESEEGKAHEQAVKAFKEKAKDNNKWKTKLKETDNKDLVAPWDKSMNKEYDKLQARVRGE